MAHLDSRIVKQVNHCLSLLNEVFGSSLSSVYLYGSALVGGLQKYSDIDLFVVLERAATDEEKQKLVNALLQISGLYMKSVKLPIELTIVVKSEVNPWHYPPRFDFQYGEWLRSEFENGIIDPWESKVMPDLALIITQINLASVTLFGSNPDITLCVVPYRDFILATKASLIDLKVNLNADTRNVMLTYARIWCTLETNAIHSKLSAARWAVSRLPIEYQPVLIRASSICKGETNENWGDIQHLIQPCAEFMADQIDRQIRSVENAKYANRSIHLE